MAPPALNETSAGALLSLTISQRLSAPRVCLPLTIREDRERQLPKVGPTQYQDCCTLSSHQSVLTDLKEVQGCTDDPGALPANSGQVPTDSAIRVITKLYQLNHDSEERGNELYLNHGFQSPV